MLFKIISTVLLLLAIIGCKISPNPVEIVSESVEVLETVEDVSIKVKVNSRATGTASGQETNVSVKANSSVTVIMEDNDE